MQHTICEINIHNYCQYSFNFIQKLHTLNNQALINNKKTIDINNIEKAIQYCKYYHGSQLRKSGIPYYTHPIEVASMVSEYKFEEKIIISALLHDTIEDTNITYEIIEQEFGSRVKEIVYRLTRIRDEVKVSVERIIDECIECCDIDAIIVKICDRLHNMESLWVMRDEKRIDIAKETSEHIIKLFRYANFSTNLIHLKNQIRKILEKEKNILSTLKYYDF